MDKACDLLGASNMNTLRLDGRSLSRLVVATKARLAAVRAWNLTITSSLARMLATQGFVSRTRFSSDTFRCRQDWH
jgi:hypothetical protein